MRYIRNKITLTITQGSVPYLTDFTPTLDKLYTEESGDNVSIAVGGTFIEFPTQYHFPPYVTTTLISSTPLIVSQHDVTKYGFRVNVWNSATTDVGGIINWTAKGV